MKKFVLLIMLVLSSVTFANFDGWGGSGGSGSGSSGWGSGPEAGVPSSGESQYARILSPKEAYSKWQQNATFIPVNYLRDLEKYGMIRRSIIHNDFGSESLFKKRIQSYSKSKTYVIYDVRDGWDGRAAARLMADMGFRKVYYLRGGLNEWKKYGYRVVYP